jgi:uncharacterized membrane protein YfcA
MTNPPIARRRPRFPLLRRWYGKFCYIIVGIALYYLLGALGPNDVSRGILRSIIVALLVLFAARVFRGRTETTDEPRPWWRMTGAPTAGFILGVLFGFAGLGLFVYAIAVETDAMVRQYRSQEPYVVVTCIVFVVLAVLYVTSSIRLVEAGRAARAEALKNSSD